MVISSQKSMFSERLSKYFCAKTQMDIKHRTATTLNLKEKLKRRSFHIWFAETYTMPNIYPGKCVG